MSRRILSRYFTVPVFYRAQFASGAGIGQSPVTVDPYRVGRPTTWGAAIGAFKYTTKAGDTMWSLAARFYLDPRKWWIIADLNVHVFYPLDLKAKTELLIQPLAAVGEMPSLL